MQPTDQDSLSGRIHAAGAALVETARIHGSDFAEHFNNTMNRFLWWPFKAGRAYLTDDEGNVREFESVVYTEPTAPLERMELQGDAVAAVIHVVGILDRDRLREGYERIAIVKRLKRTQVKEGGYRPRNTPLGIVFAINSESPIERIAEHMLLLNKYYPATEWPDMVVVAERGTINYAVQFYGEKNIRADFYLPDPGALAAYPMYVHMITRGLGLFSMNKMCWFLFVHLCAFSPGSGLPDLNEISEGLTSLAITIDSYQSNLKGELVPSRNLLWEQGKIAPLPYRIEDGKGELLSHLEFVPWQDGGILHLTGKLPLEGILLFLGDVARNAKTIRLQPDGVVTNVLPIGNAEFAQLLSRIQRQTNMRVRPETLTGIVLSKVYDEGSSSPTIARLFLGIQRLRDVVFTDDESRKRFDVPYQFVLETTMNVRATARQITALLGEHHQKVSSGEIARLTDGMILITEDISSELQRIFAEFLNSTVRVVKDGMQELARFFGLDIGFLFQKHGAFEKGAVELTRTRPELAAYLKETRKWSERLVSLRNEMHEGWMLPKMTYAEVKGTVHDAEPTILGQTVSAFVGHMLDRLCCFVEEVVVYGLQAKMPAGLSITEVPITERKMTSPERFQITFIGGGMPIWSIAYHDSVFEQT